MINERIRAVRTQFDLTMEKFGERISVKKSSVSLMESGKINPSERTIRLICQEFGVSYAWLKDGVGDMLVEEGEDDAVNRIMLGQEEFPKQVFRALAKLPPEAWEAFRSFCESLKSDANKKSGA